MKKLLGSLILLGVLTSVVWAQKTESELPALWQKGKTWYDKSVGINPEKLIVIEIIKNEEGYVEESSELEIAVENIPDEDPRFRLVSASKDGKENLEERLKTFAEDQVFYIPVNYILTPFAKEVKNLRVKKLKKSKEIRDEKCIGFSFEYRAEENEVKGSAWLEKRSGRPVMLEYELADFEVEDVQVHGGLTRTFFKKDKKGRCVADAEFTLFNIAYSSVFYDWKGTSEIEIKFGNFK